MSLQPGLLEPDEFGLSPASRQEDPGLRERLADRRDEESLGAPGRHGGGEAGRIPAGHPGDTVRQGVVLLLEPTSGKDVEVGQEFALGVALDH